MAKDAENIFTASRIFSWFQKGSFAVLDQALFSGANFITSVLLARWLTPVQYGAYAFAFSLFLLIGAFHSSIFTEPMLVFGGGKYRQNQPRYTAILIYGHLVTMLPIAVLLLAAGLSIGIFHSIYVRNALLGLAIGGPLVLLLWITRRAFYIRLQPARSALGGAVYLAIFLTAIYLLHINHRLSPATAFIAMGLTALFVSIFFIYGLRPQWKAISSLTPKEVVRDHWKYGRWSLATSIVSWFPYNIYFLILPLWLGLKGAAILKVVMNIGMIAIMSNAAISMFLIPLFSRDFYEDKNKMASVTKFFTRIFSAGNFLFALVVIFFPREIMSILYGRKYQEFCYLVPLVALISVPSGISAVLASALRAMERPDRVFWCFVIASFVTLCCGIPLAIGFGIEGTIFAILLSFLVVSIFLLIFARNLLYR
jgi:O-antigen/teichoic acid export membrane protein